MYSSKLFSLFYDMKNRLSYEQKWLVFGNVLFGNNEFIAPDRWTNATFKVKIFLDIPAVANSFWHSICQQICCKVARVLAKHVLHFCWKPHSVPKLEPVSRNTKPSFAVKKCCQKFGGTTVVKILLSWLLSRPNSERKIMRSNTKNLILKFHYDLTFILCSLFCWAHWDFTCSFALTSIFALYPLFDAILINILLFLYIRYMYKNWYCLKWDL